MTVKLGLIHPPVGMNVFVIKSVVQDVTFSSIFRGVLPFIATDILRLIILIAFPDHRALAAQPSVRLVSIGTLANVALHTKIQGFRCFFGRKCFFARSTWRGCALYPLSTRCA